MKGHKCFSMNYGYNLGQIPCTPLTILLMVIFTLKRGKINDKSNSICFFCLSGASMMYSVSARGCWPYFILKHL